MALLYRLIIFLGLCVVSVSPVSTSAPITTTPTPLRTTATQPTTTPNRIRTTTRTTRSPGIASPGNPATSGGALTGAAGRPGISNCGLGCKLGLPRQSFNFGNPNFRGMGSGGSTLGAGLHGTLQCFAFSVVAIFVHLTLC